MAKLIHKLFYKQKSSKELVDDAGFKFEFGKVNFKNSPKAKIVFKRTYPHIPKINITAKNGKIPTLEITKQYMMINYATNTTEEISWLALSSN